jgi:RHS repeat-associated protein
VIHACPAWCSGKASGTDVTTYEYDIAERMSAVKHNGITLGSYQYDPFGRRVKKVTSAGAVYFHYDDTGLLAEYDASGQLISEYQYQPGNHWMTHPLFKRDGATGKVHYYYNSHLGQPLKLFDKAGRTTWSARSQAFGQTDVVVNETENPLRFPGQYEDGETGLYYNWHRYYDVGAGRYVQEDPLRILAGLNYYQYALGNPLKHIDPTGEVVPLILALGAIGGAFGAIGSGADYAIHCDSFTLPGYGKSLVRGAIVGGLATMVGAAAVSVGAPVLVGAAIAGVASTALGMAMSGGFDGMNAGGVVKSLARGAILGAVTGGVAGRLLPIKPGTFMPKLLKPRRLSEYGVNSQKMLGSEAIGGALGAMLSVSAGKGKRSSSSSGSGCGC